MQPGRLSAVAWRGNGRSAARQRRSGFATGHTYYCHYSQGAPPIDYFIAAAGKDLQHMHIQDADGHADRHWRPGKGTINWIAVFEALQLSGANQRLIIELDTPNRHEALQLGRNGTDPVMTARPKFQGWDQAKVRRARG
jgi:hypothetical protein